jgi:P27 family predicted phage terminase small subunit
MGVMTPADSAALGLYADAMARYLEAKAMVDAQGIVVPGRDGGTVANPCYRVERDRWMLAWRAGAAFGLDPSARVSLATIPVYERSALDALLT